MGIRGETFFTYKSTANQSVTSWFMRLKDRSFLTDIEDLFITMLQSFWMEPKFSGADAVDTDVPLLSSLLPPSSQWSCLISLKVLSLQVTSGRWTFITWCTTTTRLVRVVTSWPYMVIQTHTKLSTHQVRLAVEKGCHDLQVPLSWLPVAP